MATSHFGTQDRKRGQANRLIQAIPAPFLRKMSVANGLAGERLSDGKTRHGGVYEGDETDDPGCHFGVQRHFLFTGTAGSAGEQH